MSKAFVIIKMCYVHNQWYNISCATLYIKKRCNIIADLTCFAVLGFPYFRKGLKVPFRYFFKIFIRHIKYVLHVLIIVTFAFFILDLETLRPKHVPYLPSPFYDPDFLYQLLCNRVLNGASLRVGYRGDCP